jgi:hypothetical protein
MGPDASITTFPNVALVTETLHVIKPDGATSSAVVGLFDWLPSRESQLSADNLSSSFVPEVITDCPPLVWALDVYLQTTCIVVRAVHQTDLLWFYKNDMIKMSPYKNLKLQHVYSQY